MVAIFRIHEGFDDAIFIVVAEGVTGGMADGCEFFYGEMVFTEIHNTSFLSRLDQFFYLR